jgi:tetratricopeptide (TPR) repeat protein
MYHSVLRTQQRLSKSCQPYQFTLTVNLVHRCVFVYSQWDARQWQRHDRYMSSTTGKRQNWKQQQKKSDPISSTTRSIPASPPFIKDERILSRPPNEKVSFTDSKFPLPDKGKENELTRLQIRIQDLHKDGNYSSALTLSETLVKDTIAHFGSNHPATAASYNNLGLMRKLQGQFDEARQDYVKAQDIYRDVVGADHSSYANTLHNLGNLNRTQIHLDTTLSATDRLSLVESALRYLEEAYKIRLAELGPSHPHTVSSRSSWGATLAAQILHHHKVTSTISQGGDLMRKRFYVSILPTEVADSAWIAAEEHLREALTTAIKNPRGMTTEQATTKTTNSPPQRGKRKIKPAPKLNTNDPTASTSAPQTLSAASAAQNLAVFLKTRATTIQPYEMNWLKEAETLYRQVLHVQNVLLIPKTKNSKVQIHPDMYATKHSLAEVLEAMGQLDAANEIRQEMLDTFDPPKPASSDINNETISPSSLSSTDLDATTMETCDLPSESISQQQVSTLFDGDILNVEVTESSIKQDATPPT